MPGGSGMSGREVVVVVVVITAHSSRRPGLEPGPIATNVHAFTKLWPQILITTRFVGWAKARLRRAHHRRIANRFGRHAALCPPCPADAAATARTARPRSSGRAD